MAASLTEAMPVPPAMESTQLRLLKSTTPVTSGQLFRPLQPEATMTKTETAGPSSSRVDQQRIQPARKKLATLEAQRVMAVLTTAIRRVELASVLPQLVAERREDLGIGFGVELTRRLEEHGVLLQSLDELRDAEIKRQSRASSAASVGSARSNLRGDSVLSERPPSNADGVTPTAITPAADRVISPISTRSPITFSATVFYARFRTSGELASQVG